MTGSCKLSIIEGLIRWCIDTSTQRHHPPVAIACVLVMNWVQWEDVPLGVGPHAARALQVRARFLSQPFYVLQPFVIPTETQFSSHKGLAPVTSGSTTKEAHATLHSHVLAHCQKDIDFWVNEGP